MSQSLSNSYCQEQHLKINSNKIRTKQKGAGCDGVPTYRWGASVRIGATKRPARRGAFLVVFAAFQMAAMFDARVWVRDIERPVCFEGYLLSHAVSKPSSWTQRKMIQVVGPESSLCWQAVTENVGLRTSPCSRHARTLGRMGFRQGIEKATYHDYSK